MPSIILVHSISQRQLKQWMRQRQQAMPSVAAVIGGGVSNAGTLITDAIYKEYKKNFFLTDKKNNIILAELGNDAGIIGAAALVSEEGKFGYII